ncbi:Peptidoglycan-binding domain 1 protein [Rhodobacter ferrooxidans]|uniref:Peptidoglycan-binding domain 1 protein n=2 Tax=Rhodobacter ferrooxidans TaxID=371731 RepID=C8S5R0_9RHOB|nr:Peptidoglycan-binding domain 1 protein [Rhodobacter sp. SW2]
MGTASLLIVPEGNSPTADFVRAGCWSVGQATRHAPTVWSSRKLLRQALFVVLGSLAGLTLMVPALADQNAAATALPEDPAVTALVAEADAAYAAAADLSGADKRQGLLKVKAMIDKIATHYPASHAALAILLGKKVGTVDPMALDAELTALGSNAATATGTTAPAAAPLADPLFKRINQCLTAPNLPAVAVGDAKVKLRLQTGADGAISGMPGLIEPVSPNAPERQLFNRSLLGLGACIELIASQHNSIVEFSVSAQGVIDGSVLRTEVAPPQPNTAPSSTVSSTDPAVNASQPSLDWAPATSQTQDTLNLKRPDIAEIQARLMAMSYDPEGIDGLTGAGFRSALGLWQTSAGIPSTGYLDGPQLDRLKVDSESAFDLWKANSDHFKLLSKASAAPKTGVRRSHNGWYRATGGSYCRRGKLGLWCQPWKPRSW